MKSLLIILLLFLFFGSLAQGDLPALLATTHSSADAQSLDSHRLQSFIQGIPSTSQNQSRQLRKIFRGLHSEFLKKYKAYSDFDEIFSSGQYDCLTATALFCNVLDNFYYSYDIIETNYHIFLIVKTSDKQILIETTDPWGGFITQRTQVAKRITQYQKNIPPVDSSDYVYQYSFSLYQKISKKNLDGLLYFNQAVKAFNLQDWESSSIALEKSNSLYASPRCAELADLLIQAISESELDEKTKADCKVRLNNFLPVHIASN